MFITDIIEGESISLFMITNEVVEVIFQFHLNSFFHIKQFFSPLFFVIHTKLTSISITNDSSLKLPYSPPHLFPNNIG